MKDEDVSKCEQWQPGEVECLNGVGCEGKCLNCPLKQEFSQQPDK